MSPIGDFTDFDDCVAKNTGLVEDPEAYCAEIERQASGPQEPQQGQSPVRLATQRQRPVAG